MVLVGNTTSKIKQLAFRLLACLGALTIAVTVLEILLWSFAPVSHHEFVRFIADGFVGWRATPHQVLKNADGHEVRINSLGFRGPERKLQPEIGTLRIVVLGGSSTFNYHASGEQNTWPSHLERLLALKLQQPVEVINLGLPGYSLSQSKANYLFTGRALNPHLVLVYHTWNDMKFFREAEEGNPGVRGPYHRPRPAWHYWVRHSQLVRRFRNVRQSHRQYMVENKYTSLELSDNRANAPVVDDALRWFERNFRDVARFVRADRRLPVLLTQATLVKSTNKDGHEIRRHINFDSQGMTFPILLQTWKRCNTIIESVAKQEDAVFVDVQENVPADKLHLRDHVHLTDKGTEAVARIVAETLVENDLFLETAIQVKQPTAE